MFELVEQGRRLRKLHGVVLQVHDPLYGILVAEGRFLVTMGDGWGGGRSRSNVWSCMTSFVGNQSYAARKFFSASRFWRPC